MSDESSVVAGLLVGLNVLDVNLCLKLNNDDYDQPVLNAYIKRSF